MLDAAEVVISVITICSENPLVSSSLSVSQHGVFDIRLGYNCVSKTTFKFMSCLVCAFVPNVWLSGWHLQISGLGRIEVLQG